MSVNVDRIPILDLKPEIDANWEEINAAIQRVLKSAGFILGPEVEGLEKECAEYLGVKHAIGCNSGTDALFIGLRAMGVNPGDEVITTPFSFFATAESISLIGAKPVFVDVDLESMNIDVDLIEAAITDKTKAIMPVHIFGRPANMNRVMEIAKKHNLQVIEDCAQSFGSRYHDAPGNPMTGTIGAVGTISFFPTKNLGAYGDAGMIITNDDDINVLSRKLRVHGSAKRYHNEMIGYNSRLDAMQAAILRVKLPLLPGYNETRRAIAARYNDLMAGMDEVVTPEVVPGHVFHQYTIRVKGGKRDEVHTKMADKGVSSMIYYPIPQDRLEVYAGQYPRNPNSDQLATEVLSLPIWPQIAPEQQARVVEVLKESLV
jgi:dTDP-4-amino-4,6-dideoxygalactose transaminase